MQALKRFVGGKDSTSSDSSNSNSNGVEDETAEFSAASEGKQLTASSGKLKVTLRQSTSTVSLGSVLEGEIRVDNIAGCKAIKIGLHGEAGATVMGRTKFESVGVQAALGGGIGSVSAAPLTYREVHTFLETTEVLWQQNEGEDKTSSDEAAGPLVMPFSLDMPRNRTCACEGPAMRLPPTTDLRNSTSDGITDRSTTEIVYTLRIKLEKHGKLKRDTRMRIPLLVVDDSPPDYSSTEYKVARGKGPMKYASEGEEPPMVEVELSFKAPTARSGKLPYEVAYRLVKRAPDDPLPGYDEEAKSPMEMSPTSPTAESGFIFQPNAPLFSQIKPKIEVVLTRRANTRPIERPKNGQPFEFASHILTAGKNDSSTENDGIGQVAGLLQVPMNEVTAFTCGAEVRHDVAVKLTSPAMRRPIFLKRNVVLPSA